MATPGYKATRPMKQWETGSSNTITPILPTPTPNKKLPNDRFIQPSLQYVQALQSSKQLSKQGLHTPTLSLPSGRRRSVSFDETYFQHSPSKEHHLSNLSSATDSYGPLHSGTNFSRHMTSGQRSKEWDHWSDDGDNKRRGRSSTLILPGVKSERNKAREVQNRQPPSSLYKRGIYPYHNHHPLGWQANTDSMSSFTSRSSDYSHLGRYRKGRLHHQRKVRYENTYRMEPAVNFHSMEGEIRKMMESYLDDILGSLAQNKSASATDVANAAKELAELVKQQVKLKRLQRYKIVSVANVCQKSGQDLISASQCVWDIQTDGFIAVSKQYKEWFGEVSLYALYQE